MEILKTVLCVVCAGVIVAGCKGGEKKVEKKGESVVQGAPVASAVVSAGEVTVADIYAKKDELNGKSVTLKGKVVKVNLGIMGTNWIHVQDGTGGEGTNDITITTEGQANLDDKVVVRGIVVTNKDFGSGYKYGVIIENGTVIAE